MIAAAGAVAAALPLLFVGGCNFFDDLPLAGGNTSGEQSVLTLFAPPSPAEAAAMAVNEFNPDERQSGILLLSNAPWGGADVYVRLYRMALQDEDSAVRSAAVRALGLHGEPNDAPEVAGLLSDPDRLVRWEAGRTLQRLHNPLVVGSLISSLDQRRESSSQVRAAAATALGQYAEQRVLDALVLALDDPDLTVNAAARQSLSVLTGQDFGFEPRPWLAFVRSSPDPFAERAEYRYPAFYRKRKWFEFVNPFFVVPNEQSAAPVGMTGEAVRSRDRSGTDSGQ